MAYRQVYFRIHTKGYSSGWSSDADRSAFKGESRRLFQELGWTIKLGHNGGCNVAAKGQQDLYLHPTSFSGVMGGDNVQPLQEQLLNAQTFHCEGVDSYEEYQDLSDEGYRAALEAQRDEITSYMLERCRTKLRNLYIVAPSSIIPRFLSSAPISIIANSVSCKLNSDKISIILPPFDPYHSTPRYACKTVIISVRYSYYL